jgi:hypothetical protein
MPASSIIEVANVRADGIIGLDFLKNNDCIIDIVSKRLVVGKKSFNVHFEGQLGCYRVVASETVSMNFHISQI